MEYVRWYDKDVYLSPIMKLLESLPLELQKSTAQELIQIIFGYAQAETDEKIKFLNNIKLQSYKRWYDKDYDMYSAVELFKTLNENEKKELSKAIFDFLLQIMNNFNEGKND